MVIVEGHGGARWPFDTRTPTMQNADVIALVDDDDVITVVKNRDGTGGAISRAELDSLERAADDLIVISA